MFMYVVNMFHTAQNIYDIARFAIRVFYNKIGFVGVYGPVDMDLFVAKHRTVVYCKHR